MSRFKTECPECGEHLRVRKVALLDTILVDAHLGVDPSQITTVSKDDTEVDCVECSWMGELWELED